MTARLRYRLGEEGGWALVTAMLVMAMMLALGLAVFAIVDEQQRLSGMQRQGDTAFNLAEAALNAEMFALGNQWPGFGAGANPYPTCTQTSTDTRCPDPATLSHMFNTPDTASGTTWQVNVYDNGQSSGSFYSDSITTTQPSYDANGDGKLWVRAQSTVRGRTRVLVGEVQVQLNQESLPHAATIAGSLQTSNNGRKVIIDTQGSALQPAPVEVRCNPLINPNCLVYQAAKGQISPDTTAANYTGGNSLSAAALARLKATAIDNGTYYTACPGALPSGPVVWLQSVSCSFTGNSVANSANSPGALIVDNGTLSLGGTTSFYGLIYATNSQGSSGTVVSLSGNTQVTGGIEIDGQGGLVAGSSKVNLTFSDAAFTGLRSFGSADLLQNTFRQIAHA